MNTFMEKTEVQLLSATLSMLTAVSSNKPMIIDMTETTADMIEVTTDTTDLIQDAPITHQDITTQGLTITNKWGTFAEVAFIIVA